MILINNTVPCPDAVCINTIIRSDFRCTYVNKSPKVYTQLAREGVVLTQDSDNI